MTDIFYIILIAFGGLAIGSFLNVVIYRLPRNESIVFPPSHCPQCHNPIRWYDNIPVVSYLILRGACRTCHEHISPVYPILELLTCFFALILYYQDGLTFQFISDFSLAIVLLGAMVIDYRFMIIPDKLNAAGALIALVVSLSHGVPGIVRSIAGGVIGIVLMSGLFWLGKLLYRRDGVGFGDVKLAAVIGLFIGPLWCFIACVIAVFLGGLWGIYQLSMKRKKMGQEIPFGPFLSLGGFFVLFFKRELLYLIDRYLALL